MECNLNDDMDVDSWRSQKFVLIRTVYVWDSDLSFCTGYDHNHKVESDIKHETPEVG